MGIDVRLVEERKRLGLNQTDFAAIAGVGRKSQFSYESGASNPDAAYLAAIAAAGADIQYIVTGQRSDMALAPDERQLLTLFRAAPLTGKMAAVGALQGVVGSGVKLHVGGDFSGQTFEGDVTQTGVFSFSTGKKKK